ncbi:2-hydroxyacyl-CoA dehydratase [Chloroflexota bacterium]
MSKQGDMIIDKFREVVENRHKYAKDWKRKNKKKVMGYLCTYVPEEIIYAADILPVRILGGHEAATLADDHIAWIYCSFCHDTLAQGLKGKYNYLDGIANSYGCNHIRQTFWSWQKHVPISFSHQLFIPYYVRHEASRPLIKEELNNFKEHIEEWLGKSISREEIDRAIRIYNTNRWLLMQLYELRKGDNPPVTGAEAMQVVLASMLMDKAEHNELMEQLLKELKGREIDTEGKVRLMLVGTENDDTEVIKLIEDLGGIVVIDDHCTGSRYFWNEVIPEKDQLLGITNRLMDKPLCPVRDLEVVYRAGRIIELAKEYKVQGVIILQQKFCEPIEYDIQHIPSKLEKEGIQTLTLELDIINPSAQFRTRIEAFLEMFQLALI